VVGKGLTEFTARDCYRASPVRGRDQAKAALADLEELGWIRQVGGQWGKGGRNSPTYVVNPIATLNDTATPEVENGSDQSCVTPVAQVGRDAGRDDDTQVDPAEDTESGGEDVMRRSGSSALKGGSKTPSFVGEKAPERARERIPEDTRDTATQPIAPYDPSARPDEF
jgi:hypothetical protein